MAGIAQPCSNVILFKRNVQSGWLRAGVLPLYSLVPKPSYQASPKFIAWLMNCRHWPRKPDMLVLS